MNGSVLNGAQLSRKSLQINMIDEGSKSHEVRVEVVEVWKEQRFETIVLIFVLAVPSHRGIVNRLRRSGAGSLTFCSGNRKEAPPGIRQCGGGAGGVCLVSALAPRWRTSRGALRRGRSRPESSNYSSRTELEIQANSTKFR
jgi:hypothetical protein